MKKTRRNLTSRRHNAHFLISKGPELWHKLGLKVLSNKVLRHALLAGWGWLGLTGASWGQLGPVGQFSVCKFFVDN